MCSIGTICFFFLLCVGSIIAVDCNTSPLPNVTSYRAGYCGYVFYHSPSISGARGIDFAPNNDLLVLDRNEGRVVALWEDINGEVHEFILTPGSSLNHHVKFYKDYIYASNDTTIFRWYYPPSAYRTFLGDPEIVLTDMPALGLHLTRTMEIDPLGNFYVNIGSGGNLDPTPIRSRIIRFNLNVPPFPKSYLTDVEVFVNGSRNVVGLRVNPRDNTLWGVDNSIDDIGSNFQRGSQTRIDFGDIHYKNPGDEVNQYLEQNKGRFHGYPWCWSEGPIENGELAFPQGSGPGTQWATYNSSIDPVHTDAWCKNPDNVIKPVTVVPAHSAPLDLIFYYGKFFDLPTGSLIIPLHGSLFRQPPNGRAIFFLTFDRLSGKPLSFLPIVQGPPENWFIRPVSVAIGPCRAYGTCLYASSDRNGHIIAIAYTGCRKRIINN